jgi:hypothetical protein
MKIQNFLGIVIIVILFASLALFYYVIEIYTSATADYKLELVSPNGKVWIIDGSTDKIIKTTTLDSVPYYIEQDNL